MRSKDYILFRFTPNKSKVGGFFDEDDGFIYISERVGKFRREIIYIHEAQHRRCFQSKCHCWGNTTWCEYHAFRAELQYVISENRRLLWKAFFRAVDRSLKDYQSNKVKGWPEHLRALKRMCKLKAFKEAKEKYGSHAKRT